MDGNGASISGHDLNHTIFLRVGRDGTSDTIDICDYGMIRFFTNGGINNQTERMRIQQNGNIGIGTPAPVEKLHVEGNVMISANLIVNPVIMTQTNYNAKRRLVDYTHFQSGNSSTDTEPIVNITSNSTYNGPYFSIGENSISYIENVIIENSLVGIAVKDSSKVKGNDINFSNINIANVMTYIKKDYFDGSKVNLSNIKFSKDLFINQKNSSLIVNERNIQPENLDVKKLYKTVMKSNK